MVEAGDHRAVARTRRRVRRRCEVADRDADVPAEAASTQRRPRAAATAAASTVPRSPARCGTTAGRRRLADRQRQARRRRDRGGLGRRVGREPSQRGPRSSRYAARGGAPGASTSERWPRAVRDPAGTGRSGGGVGHVRTHCPPSRRHVERHCARDWPRDHPHAQEITVPDERADDVARITRRTTVGGAALEFDVRSRSPRVSATSTRSTTRPVGSAWTGRSSPRPATRPTTASSRTPSARTATRWTRWCCCQEPTFPGCLIQLPRDRHVPDDRRGRRRRQGPLRPAPRPAPGAPARHRPRARSSTGSRSSTSSRSTRTSSPASPSRAPTGSAAPRPRPRSARRFERAQDRGPLTR